METSEMSYEHALAVMQEFGWKDQGDPVKDLMWIKRNLGRNELPRNLSTRVARAYFEEKGADIQTMKDLEL